MKAVTTNLSQVAYTFLLGVMIIYVMTIWHFYFYRGFVYEVADGVPQCDTMLHCLLGYIDFGLRGPSC